jgi:hypothetical protein
MSREERPESTESQKQVSGGWVLLLFGLLFVVLLVLGWLTL